MFSRIIAVFSIKLTCLQKTTHFKYKNIRVAFNRKSANFQHDKMLLYQIYAHICVRKVFLTLFMSKFCLTWCWLSPDKMQRTWMSLWMNEQMNECTNVRANKQTDACRLNAEKYFVSECRVRLKSFLQLSPT